MDDPLASHRFSLAGEEPRFGDPLLGLGSPLGDVSHCSIEHATDRVSVTFSFSVTSLFSFSTVQKASKELPSSFHNRLN